MLTCTTPVGANLILWNKLAIRAHTRSVVGGGGASCGVSGVPQYTIRAVFVPEKLKWVLVRGVGRVGSGCVRSVLLSTHRERTPPW